MNTIHHASLEAANGATPGRLGRLARFTSHYRWPVIAAWIALTAARRRRRRQAQLTLVSDPRRPRPVGL